MKRKLNESSVCGPNDVCICTSCIRADYPFADCNKLRDRLEDEGLAVTGKNVENEDGDVRTVMIIHDEDEFFNDETELMEYIADVLELPCDADEMREYLFIEDDFDTTGYDNYPRCGDYPDYDEVDIEEPESANPTDDFPPYESVDIDNDDEPLFDDLNESRKSKRKRCCPTVNESIVLNDINKAANKFNKIAKKSIKKLMLENVNVDLQNKTLKALKEGKAFLHENAKINGISFNKITIKDLKEYKKKALKNKDILTESLKNTNRADVKEKLEKNNNLLKLIEEELTYRLTRLRYLNESEETDDGVMSDDQLKDLFGPAQGESADDSEEDTKSKEGSDEAKEDSDEETEEVELARIDITLKDAEAVEKLKQACLDAGIPEDAFEISGVEEGEDKEDEEKEDEEKEGEEASEESTEEDNESEDANESYVYAKYVKMLAEAEEVEDDDKKDEEADEEDEEEDTEEDDKPKFSLIDTDYAAKLAEVLDTVYGISKEEFEEMIGGEIVEEEEEEKSEEDDEDIEDHGEEEEEDDKKSDDEEKDDDGISPEDLFKGL